MREGVDRRGRHLYPAFPYDHFTRVTDEDLHAIYACLMTREPVAFEAPDNELPCRVNIRMLLAEWKLLFLDSGSSIPENSRTQSRTSGPCPPSEPPVPAQTLRGPPCMKATGTVTP